MSVEAATVVAKVVAAVTGDSDQFAGCGSRGCGKSCSGSEANVVAAAAKLATLVARSFPRRSRPCLWWSRRWSRGQSRGR